MNPTDLAAFAEEGAPPDEEMGMEGEEEELPPEEKFARLIPLLQENDDEVTDAYDALDQALVMDDAAPMEPDDQEMLMGDFGELAPELQSEIKATCSGLQPDDAAWISGQVDTADPERLTAWLYRLGQALSTPPPEDMTDEGSEMGEEEPARIGTGLGTDMKA